MIYDFESLIAHIEFSEWSEASSLLVEVSTPYFSQLIGPFSKDDPTVLAVIERLQSEVDPEDDHETTFKIRLLFPCSFADLPGLEVGQ